MGLNCMETKPHEIYIPVESVFVPSNETLDFNPGEVWDLTPGYNLVTLSNGAITKQFDTLKTLVEIVHDPLGPNSGERGNPAIVKPIGFRREPLPYEELVTELGLTMLRPLRPEVYADFLRQIHIIMREKGGYRVRE
ncbi:hypothetical protein GF371_02605 [Candidatus Woesearchaeota archaeon]|nr:hypothetical protein [Candidatus Woesearchaeota archaeon]